MNDVIFSSNVGVIADWDIHLYIFVSSKIGM